jgi:putative ABC transport system permease protein
MRIAEALRENVGQAMTTMRVNKMRSSLTVLGVVIGVATVMTMATLVEGIRQQIVRTIEVAGPTTFYVVKVFSQTPLNPDRLPKYVRIRPNLTAQEAERIAALPEIAYGGIWAQVFGRMEYEGVRTQQVTFFGADDHYPDIQGGGLTAGRWFTRAELVRGDAVAVIDESIGRFLFARASALGKLIRVAGRPVRVIGLYQPPDNIFIPPGQQVGAILPFQMVDHQYTVDKNNFLFVAVKPLPSVRVEDAQSAVTVTLRNMRHLRPGEPNTFDLITQDQVLDTFNKLTDVFFLVMIALSAVALLVGGIGVMAIMMVSVTDRTREIGVRKALGATRGDILLQFLTEAASLTGIGGLAGIVVGLGLGRLTSIALKLQASTPIVLTTVAVVVSVAIGVVFGIIPANRAARLDPIEALRYE